MRELSDDSIQYQAEQLAAYVRRGGDPARWVESKDFGREDAARIMAAFAELTRECA